MRADRTGKLRVLTGVAVAADRKMVHAEIGEIGAQSHVSNWPKRHSVSSHRGHQSLVRRSIAHHHVKPITGRQFQWKVETSGELDVAGDNSRRHRRVKIRG